MGDDKKAIDLGLLEEEDHFEEFPTEDWDTQDENTSDVNVWEDNWDDDTVEDDFSVQLSKINRKRSLTRSPHATATPPAEPLSKRLCARPSPLRNGHHSDQKPVEPVNDVPMADAAGDETPPGGRGSRSGRTTRSTPRSDEENGTMQTPTRSSARLRSSRK